MKAMILAAGEGRRMRPLTLATPKPLLRVGHCSLLEHQIRKLLAAGITELVINVAYLPDQIISALQQMELSGVHCDISVEETALETGGGLLQALPYLDGGFGNEQLDEPFLLVNGDVWTNYNYTLLVEKASQLAPNIGAHLVLVDNPEHHPHGDFCINEGGQLAWNASSAELFGNAYTFSGISLIRPSFIRDYPRRANAFPLAEVLKFGMAANQVSGEHYSDLWIDVGTIERLDAVRALFASTSQDKS